MPQENARADAENARNAFEEVYLRVDGPDRWLEAQRDAHDAAVSRLVAALAAVTQERDEWKDAADNWQDNYFAASEAEEKAAAALAAAEERCSAAYEDASTAEIRAGRIFESERECWDAERGNLRTALAAAEEARDEREKLRVEANTLWHQAIECAIAAEAALASAQEALREFVDATFSHKAVRINHALVNAERVLAAGGVQPPPLSEPERGDGHAPFDSAASEGDSLPSTGTSGSLSGAQPPPQTHAQPRSIGRTVGVGHIDMSQPRP